MLNYIFITFVVFQFLNQNLIAPKFSSSLKEPTPSTKDGGK